MSMLEVSHGTPCSTAWQARAALRPSATALTTSLPPLTQSPPENTFGLPVAPVAGSATTQPRASSATPGNCCATRAQLRLPDGDARRGRTAGRRRCPLDGRAVARRDDPQRPDAPARVAHDRPSGCTCSMRRTPSLRAPRQLVLVAAHLLRRRAGRPSSTSSAPSCAHSRATSSAVFPPPTTTTRPSFGRAAACELHLLDPRRRADDARARLRPGSPSACPRRARGPRNTASYSARSCAPVTSRADLDAGPDRPHRATAPTRPRAATSSRVQLVRRDAGRVEPARQGALLEDGRVVPLERELRREGERRRARAHARDALARRRLRARQQTARAGRCVAVSVA